MAARTLAIGGDYRAMLDGDTEIDFMLHAKILEKAEEIYMERLGNMMGAAIAGSIR